MMWNDNGHASRETVKRSALGGAAGVESII